MGMEARGLGIGGVDQRLRHAVAGEIVEADILEGEAQLLRAAALGGAGLAGKEARDVDQRESRRRSGSAAQGWHRGSDCWSIGRPSLSMWVNIATNAPSVAALACGRLPE